MGCSICRHPRRIAIDADLTIGTPYRAIIHLYDAGSLATLHSHSLHYRDVPYLVPELQPTLFDEVS